MYPNLQRFYPRLILRSDFNDSCWTRFEQQMSIYGYLQTKAKGNTCAIA